MPGATFCLLAPTPKRRTTLQPEGIARVAAS